MLKKEYLLQTELNKALLSYFSLAINTLRLWFDKSQQIYYEVESTTSPN